MTKGKIYTTILLLLTLMACTNNETEYFPDVYISFDPIVVANTRMADAEVYPYDRPFKVWAYSLPNGKSWEKNKDQIRPFMENVVISYKEGKWLPNTSYMWPPNCVLTVHAYSPQDLIATFTPDQGITFKNFDTNSGIVPMFSYPVQSNNGLLSGGCIALPMVRTLTKLEFAIRTIVSSDSVMILKSLCLDEVAYKGDFHSLPYAHWIVGEERMSLEFCNSPIKVISNRRKVGERLIMAQTTHASLKAIIDICDKKGNVIVSNRQITSQPLNKVWKVGKYYNYTLNLSTREIKLTTEIPNYYEEKEN